MDKESELTTWEQAYNILGRIAAYNAHIEELWNDLKHDIGREYDWPDNHVDEVLSNFTD